MIYKEGDKVYYCGRNHCFGPGIVKENVGPFIEVEWSSGIRTRESSYRLKRSSECKNCPHRLSVLTVGWCEWED